MRLLLTNSNVDFASMENEHRSKWEHLIHLELDKLIRRKSGPAQSYLIEIKGRLPILLIAKPSELRKAKSELELFRAKIPKQFHNALTKRLLKIFDYDGFVSSYLPHWGAYKFTEMLNVNACVYCNRLFTFTLDRVDQARRLKKNKAVKLKLKDIDSARTRPELDHFYPKDQYPYLALSLYNMIPSCHVCNSNFKGKRALNFDLYLHPFEDDFHDAIKIKAVLRNRVQLQDLIDQGKLSGNVNDYFGTQLFVGKLNSFDLVFVPRSTAQSSINKKAENHIQLFALKELYDMHKAQASRMIKNAIVHGSGAVADIFSRHPGLFHSEEEVRSSLMGNETDPDKINQSPLSKLTIDILEDFKI